MVGLDFEETAPKSAAPQAADWLLARDYISINAPVKGVLSLGKLRRILPVARKKLTTGGTEFTQAIRDLSLLRITNPGASSEEETAPKLRSAPRLFRVMGRPNSPPPELLNAKVRFLAWDVNPPFVPCAGTNWLSPSLSKIVGVRFRHDSWLLP